MAKISRSFSEYIKAKELSLTDDFYTLKGNYINTDYGFNYMAYDALKDVNDIKTNNYSNIILTKKQKRSDILEAKGLISHNSNTDFITTLSFIAPDNSNELKKPIYLVIDNIYEDFDIDGANTEVKLVENLTSITNNMFFRINCLDESTCNISSNIGNATFYLYYNGVFGYTNKLNDLCTFNYHLVDNKLRLYINHDGMLYTVYCKDNNTGYTLSASITAQDEERSIIYVNSQLENIDSFINESWIRYNRKNSVDKINSTRSKFNNESQVLIHHEYNDDDNQVNLIPLKNTLTYQGTVTDGQCSTLSNNGKFIDEPMVDFRNYTSLHTGVNQEYGNDNIILTFAFTDQVIRIEEGEDCIITIPKETENGLPPLFPYEYININDTAFVRNGSFASNVPYFADNFKKLQNDGPHSNINNFTYLCTWLYQPDTNTVPVWMDRYYYPDYLSRKEALKASPSTFNLSFENILDRYYLKPDGFTEAEKNEYKINPEVEEQIESMRTAIKEETYIDKKSDLTFSPGTIYKYSRISKETVDNVFNGLAPYRAEIVKDQNSNDVSLSSLISLNGESWRKLPADFFAKSQKLSFNTNIYLNPYKKMGIQLFGMDHNVGFNIQNRKDLCPYEYYANKDSVFMLNNSFEICNQFNLKETYGEEITYFILPGPFEDIFVLTSKSIFVFDFDLRLKNRIMISEIANRTDYDTNELVRMIPEVCVIQHNKNLYAIINDPNWNRIVKIIFNPENSSETAYTMRFLNDGEYLSNVTITKDTYLSESKTIFKSLCVNKDNRLYAFNFDILKIAHDNDTVYGLIKKPKEESPANGGAESSDVDDWYYIFNQSLGRIQTSSTASRYAEFSSDVSIDNLAFGPNGSFALIRGFQTEPNLQTLEVYDKSKTKIYNYPLKEYEEILSLDYYRFIDSAFEEHDAYVALLASNKSVTAIVYYINEEGVDTFFTKLPYDETGVFKSVIDSNKILSRINENNLYFNLNLPDNLGCITHKWSLSEIEEGWYSISVNIDMDEATYNIKVNEITIGDYNSNNVPNFKKHSYSNVSFLDGTYYIGTLPKQYGTTLNEILLGDARFDPYAWKNSKIRNTTVYNKTLEYYEQQANTLHFDKINPLTLTIPCGIRNGVEEIVRYFKFNKPNSFTNKVKINIAGLSKDIKMQSQLEALKSEIITSLSNNDCLLKIKEIEFI